MKNTKGENENINTPEDRSNVYTEVVEYLKTIDDDENPLDVWMLSFTAGSEDE